MRGNGLEGDTVSAEMAQRLFIALSEQLKTPLMQIARGAELSSSDPESAATILQSIGASAGSALSLLDSYLLGAQTGLGQLSLMLEPVAITSILYETAHKLSPLAHQYDCEVVISKNRQSPIAMTNAQGLQAALTSLGSVFIEASQSQQPKKRRIILATHGRKEGVMTGVFSDLEGLTSELYRSAAELLGKAKMPIGTITTNSGAGIFVANSLLDAMTSHLEVMSRYNQQGLAAILPTSQQLKLI